MITDAQVHVWRADQPDRPWPAEGHSFAHGSDDFTGEDLVALMDAAGVDRAVLVPPSFEGDYNDLVLQACRDHPDRFMAMGRVDLQDTSAASAVARWREQDGMAGIRLTFWLERHINILRSGAADPFFSAAAEHALPLMIYPPQALDDIERVARRYPSLPIILDHLAIELGLVDAQVDASIERLLRLSDVPNISVKASGLPALTEEEFPFPSLTARVHRILAGFGRERVFWGTDLTRLTCSYQEAVDHAIHHLDLHGEDLDWFVDLGLRRQLGWTLQSDQTT